jgi:hypothetical protein
MTISAYPLQWPTGWKRTPHHGRTRARFGKASRQEGYGDQKRWVPGRDLTIAEGTARVLLELQRMGVQRDDLVLSTNLRLRLDGMPASGQAEPADPGVAVYWTDGAADKPRVMAIDIYDRVADNLAAVAATLEAMRAIERHGGAAVLERAFTGFTALPAPIVAGMKRPWREVLFPGIAYRDYTEAEIRAQYRKWARELHPDVGGDPAKMAELNAARDEALKELS